MTADPRSALGGSIPGRTLCLLQGYDGVHQAYADVVEPCSIEELRAVMKRARTSHRRMTFRAGGLSFDGQSLNDDLVVSMSRFNAIAIDPKRPTVTVGGGAPWGAIVRALEPHGLVPHVVVTTSTATAGGTVSGDCHSRFSGAGGKEGRHVERIQLMTVDGRLHDLSREGEGSALFHAVISGLGYFGAVVSVTYRVARVGPAGRPIRVATRASRHESLRGLAEALVPAIAASRSGTPGPHGAAWTGGSPSLAGPADAIYSIAFRTLTGMMGVVLHSRYMEDVERRPMLTHLPRHPLRVPIEWLLRASVISEGIWSIVDRWFFDFERPYVDDLFDYTFFMDGNVRAKRIAQALGMPMSTAQQTFMIPFDWGDREQSLGRLVSFLEDIDRVTTRDEIPPTLLDILYLEGDDFLMSSNHRMDAFGVTLAFETSDEESVNSIRRALVELSAVAWRLGGRVHLVKNVYASSEDMEAMYAHALPEFVRLKQLVDPDGVLRNEFLERVFPAHFPPRGARRRP